MADSPGDARERVLFEGQRVTIIANAAGALALLVFLHAIWLSAGAVSLKRFVLYGIAAFAAGVGVALIGYVARYWALSRNAGVFHQIALMDSAHRGRLLRGGAGASGRRRTGLAREPGGAADADGAEETVGWGAQSFVGWAKARLRAVPTWTSQR